eukprot:scaffold84417_cov29-Prasinocladus_malaysianus.AAC.1
MPRASTTACTCLRRVEPLRNQSYACVLAVFVLKVGVAASARFPPSIVTSAGGVYYMASDRRQPQRCNYITPWLFLLPAARRNEQYLDTSNSAAARTLSHIWRGGCLFGARLDLRNPHA